LVFVTEAARKGGLFCASPALHARRARSIIADLLIPIYLARTPADLVLELAVSKETPTFLSYWFVLGFQRCQVGADHCQLRERKVPAVQVLEGSIYDVRYIDYRKFSVNKLGRAWLT
jgi:hypothetical protein